MHGRLSAILLSSLAMVAGLSVSAGAAPPPSADLHSAGLHCGDTVTADVVLTKSLVCVGTALRVVMNDGETVHIDLNGHYLKGDGTGVGIELPNTSGIGNLVVSDGSITGFAAALLGLPRVYPQAADVTVRHMLIKRNGSWLAPMALRTSLVEDSTIIDSGLGRVYTDTALTVRNTKLVNSSIQAASETYTHLFDNEFVRAGFSASWASDVEALRNTFTGCNVGIRLAEQWWLGTTKVENNKFIKCRIGVTMDMIYGSVSIRHNSFVRNTEVGMTFGVPHTSGRPKARDIADNVFLRNQGDGVRGAGADTVQVSGNYALRNAGHGINVSDVVDGGANVARKNATAPQCIGVVCT